MYFMWGEDVKGKDTEVEGLNAHIRDLKALVNELETKLEKYEKGHPHSQP
jgi:peptidoglycan hydrolase CwlO-like protein